MRFSKILWIDNATPLNAEHMNHLEEGIYEALDEISHMYGNFGAKISLTFDSEEGFLTVKLLSEEDVVLSESTIDLPTEKIIQSVSLDYTNKKLIFVLADGSHINCDISALINQVADKLTMNNETGSNRVYGVNADGEQELFEITPNVSAGKIVQRDAQGNIKSGTPVNNEDVSTKSYTDGVVNAHANKKDNPHQVTKEQVGLGNVDNTSDLNKPVSTAQQEALNLKVDKVAGKQLSTNDFSNEYKGQVEANTTARHTHDNKALLDGIAQPNLVSSSDRSTWNGKQDALTFATEAQVKALFN